jgi:hypothetical protein
MSMTFVASLVGLSTPFVLTGLYRRAKAKSMKKTTWDDLPMDVKRIIYKAQRHASPFPAASSNGWPDLKFGVNTTWRQALPTHVVVEIEDAIKNDSSLKLCKKWRLEDAYDRFIEGGAVEYYEAPPTGFAVWLVHDMPMWSSSRSLDDKVMDHFQEMYLKGGRPDITWGSTDLALYVEALDDEVQWLKQAEKLMEDKTYMTLYDVYEALWNKYETVSNLFRKDIESYGW